MTIFKVRNAPNGKNADEKYQEVHAASMKDAAEKFYGGPLVESGNAMNARVIVRPPIGWSGTNVNSATVFYEI